MKVLFDTSLLVAGLLEKHTHHPRAFRWLEQAKAGEHQALISCHSLAESFGVLSTFPLRPRLAPSHVSDLLHKLVSNTVQPVQLTTRDYLETIHRAAACGYSGGIIYDALIAHVALTNHVDRLITFNVKHFRRIWQGDPDVIQEP